MNFSTEKISKNEINKALKAINVVNSFYSLSNSLLNKDGSIGKILNNKVFKATIEYSKKAVKLVKPILFLDFSFQTKKEATTREKELVYDKELDDLTEVEKNEIKTLFGISFPDKISNTLAHKKEFGVITGLKVNDRTTVASLVIDNKKVLENAIKYLNGFLKKIAFSAERETKTEKIITKTIIPAINFSLALYDVCMNGYGIIKNPTDIENNISRATNTYFGVKSIKSMIQKKINENSPIKKYEKALLETGDREVIEKCEKEVFLKEELTEEEIKNGEKPKTLGEIRKIICHLSTEKHPEESLMEIRKMLVDSFGRDEGLGLYRVLYNISGCLVFTDEEFSKHLNLNKDLLVEPTATFNGYKISQFETEVICGNTDALNYMNALKLDLSKKSAICPETTFKELYDVIQDLEFHFNKNPDYSLEEAMFFTASKTAKKPYSKLIRLYFMNKVGLENNEMRKFDIFKKYEEELIDNPDFKITPETMKKAIAEKKGGLIEYLLLKDSNSKKIQLKILKNELNNIEDEGFKKYLENLEKKYSLKKQRHL